MCLRSAKLIQRHAADKHRMCVFCILLLLLILLYASTLSLTIAKRGGFNFLSPYLHRTTNRTRVRQRNFIVRLV